MKTLLILVDGMRPDAIEGIPEARKTMEGSAYALDATTVMPSVTLPCHMSLFHSVDPSRHGTTTNTYAPQVRPIKGLCEVLAAAGKKSAFFYNWEELRDLSRPGSLEFSFYSRCDERSDAYVTDAAIEYLKTNDIDFTFLYLGYVDVAGHTYGWMSDEYMSAVRVAWECIDRIVNALTDDYTVIITADHGGHLRFHGFDCPEDMLIPLIIKGKDFEAGRRFENSSIMDIAPTVTSLLGVEPNAEWEGKSLTAKDAASF